MRAIRVAQHLILVHLDPSNQQAIDCDRCSLMLSEKDRNPIRLEWLKANLLLQDVGLLRRSLHGLPLQNRHRCHSDTQTAKSAPTIRLALRPKGALAFFSWPPLVYLVGTISIGPSLLGSTGPVNPRTPPLDSNHVLKALSLIVEVGLAIGCPYRVLEP